MWEYLVVAALVAAPLLVVIGIQAIIIVRTNSRLAENLDRALSAALAAQSQDVIAIRRTAASLGRLPAAQKPVPAKPAPEVRALHVTRE